jgi:hypothetical protein
LRILRLPTLPAALRLREYGAAFKILRRRARLGMLIGMLLGIVISAAGGILLRAHFAERPAFPAQGKPTRKTHESKKIAPPTPPAEAAVPFHAGETLAYAAQWNKFVTAATIQVVVAGRGGFYGRNAWHFQATAHTLDLVRLLYALDDQFDSYTDAMSLACLQYESHIREQSKQQDNIVPMASATPPATYAAKGGGKGGSKSAPKAADAQTSRGDTHMYIVLPGTRDPLGLLYGLRVQDWQREPSARFPVFDGRRYYDVAAQKESAGDEVQVAAGKFRVTRVALHVSEGGREIPNLKFWVSLALDAERTPVLIEAEVPFGTVRVELTSKLPVGM